MMHGYLGGWNPGFGFFGMPFFGILFWIVLVLVAVYLVVILVKKIKDTGANYSAKGEDPITIAKKRYARGEITREEYEELLKDLED